MTTQDLTKVDCKLFRIPVIDNSGLDLDVNNILVDAWKNGLNPQYALDQVVKNSNIVNQIASQVEKSLSFQREQYTSQVQRETETIRKQKEEETRSKLDAIESTLGNIEQSKRTEFEQVRNLSYFHQQDISIESKRLTEMQERIQQRIENLGGNDRYKKILEINDILTTEPTEISTPKPTEFSNPKNIISESIDDVISKKYPALDLNKPHYEATSEPTIPPKKESKLKYVGKTIWKVLNYKIW